MLVDGNVTRAAVARQLIRWISNDDVELHVASKNLGEPSLDVVGVNERVGVGFQSRRPVENGFARAAILALVAIPSVFEALEPDVAIVAGEGFGDGVFAGGVLGAIHAAPREQAGDLRDADAEHLPGQDVIDALFQVRNLVLQPLGEAAGNLAQEHAGFRAGIKELHRLVGPDICTLVIRTPRLGQRVQHTVGELRRREHLVVGEVRDARQHVRVAAAQGKAGLSAHGLSPCFGSFLMARSKSDSNRRSCTTRYFSNSLSANAFATSAVTLPG